MSYADKHVGKLAHTLLIRMQNDTVKRVWQFKKLMKHDMTQKLDSWT